MDALLAVAPGGGVPSSSSQKTIPTPPNRKFHRDSLRAPVEASLEGQPLHDAQLEILKNIELFRENETLVQRVDRAVPHFMSKDDESFVPLDGYLQYALWCLSKDDAATMKSIVRARFLTLDDTKFLVKGAVYYGASVCRDYLIEQQLFGAPFRLSENPVPQPPPAQMLADIFQDRFVVIMVGLPARGKTYLSRRLARYLDFFHGVKAKIINVGDYRRECCGSDLPSKFFDHSDADSVAKRHVACVRAMEDMIAWMTQDEHAR